MIFPIGDDQVKGGFYPLFSYGFILINIAVFLFQLSLPYEQLNAFIYEYGSVPVETLEGKDLFTH